MAHDCPVSSLIVEQASKQGLRGLHLPLAVQGTTTVLPAARSVYRAAGLPVCKKCGG